LSSFEPSIKEIIRQAVCRGKLYVNVTIQGEQNNYEKLKVHPEAVTAVRDLLNSLRSESGVEEPLKLEHFLQYTEIFGTQEKIDQTDDLWKHTKTALDKALKNLKKMRIQEGETLVKDILSHLKQLKKDVLEIEKISSRNLKETHQMMVERVKTLVRDEFLNKDRLYTEIAIIADKLDVTEECVRLKSHHKLFTEIIDNEKQVGKKLNFLLQEMNREVNTISAKANNVTISHLIVQMKEEIEKLREQVQNLE
jgi:uncharacterized protein (TIGR00255 family)